MIGRMSPSNSGSRTRTPRLARRRPGRGRTQTPDRRQVARITAASIWNLAIPDIGVLPDIGLPTDTISGYVSRYRGFLLTRYRDMSHVTRYRVPISGTHPISGHHVTDIVNHIPDIGINIGYNIGCPDIGDMITRYRCQYRVPISGVPI
jgi:hypothetical protein